MTIYTMSSCHNITPYKLLMIEIFVLQNTFFSTCFIVFQIWNLENNPLSNEHCEKWYIITKNGIQFFRQHLQNN